MCELMCLSAHQLIRWCLVSVSLTNVFLVPTLAASHFLFNGGKQEIVCHLPIICDSSCVRRQSGKSRSRPRATTPPAVFRLFAASPLVSEGQRGVVRQRFHSTHLSAFAPAGSALVWEDRGDRQHAEPGFRQEVHPGLLL